MKKNIIISVLAALGIVFGLYAFTQKVKADQNLEEVIKQQGIADKIIAETLVAQIEAEKQRDIAAILQQQLDECK